MNRLGLIGASLALIVGGTALAATGDKDKALAQYERTGKLENCVQLIRIDQTRILDKSTILFEMVGKDAYLNTLPHKCPGLSKHRAIRYETSLSQLCNTDIVTVIDMGLATTREAIEGFGPGTFGSCGLGKFELLKKKPAVADAPQAEGAETN